MQENIIKRCVYLIRNIINNKIYIGKTIDFKDRISAHKNSIKYIDKNYIPIVRAIKKYGWDNFKVEILEDCTNIDNNLILEKESQYIKKYNSNNPKIGYNILKYSVDWTGMKHSEKSKKKMSKSAKKRLVHGHTGRPHSKETKQKISQHHIDSRKFLGKNNPRYGKKTSEEQKRKISESKSVPVKQIDINGNLIKIWRTSREAVLSIFGQDTVRHKQHIRLVCQKKYGYKTCIGFKWEYATIEEYEKYIQK